MTRIDDRARSGDRAPERHRGNANRAARWSARSLVLVIDGMLAGVGGVFVVTTSVPVTIVAAVAAIVLTSVIVMTQR